MSALTFDAVHKITGDADRWYGPIIGACLRYYIETPNRQAMFLATCAHESDGFKRLLESMHYSAGRLLAVFPRHFDPEEAQGFAYDDERIAERVYGGRMGNGPEGSGDGWKFRGRGLIHVTGRRNYSNCAPAVGLPLEANPEFLEQPEFAAMSAAWFWRSSDCNTIADTGDFEAVTRKVNGGTNGMPDRIARLESIREAMA